MDEPEPVRSHGLARPFHPLQMVSWAVFGSDVLIFCIFIIPLITTVSVKVAIGVSYATSVGVLVLAAVKATGRDPADPHLLCQDGQLTVKDSKRLPFCDLCNSSVMASSKHCGACNKCVNSFDHHCMWLNNCIGERNYRPFVASICSVVVMTGIVLGTSLYMLVYYFTDEDGFEKGVEDGLLPHVQKETLLSIIIVAVVVNLPLFALDLQLVVLHAFLASQNLTTYEYIMNKRSLEDEQNNIPELISGEQCDTDDSKAASSAKSTRVAKPSVLRKGFRSLPRCMDWIVFARCYKRKRRRKDNIEHISTEAKAAESEVGKISSTADLHGHERNVVPTTPLGSTLEPEGACPGQTLPSTANASPRETTSAVSSTMHQVTANDRIGERVGGEAIDSAHNHDDIGNGNAGIAARLGCGRVSDRSDRGRSQSPSASV